MLVIYMKHIDIQLLILFIITLATALWIIFKTKSKLGDDYAFYQRDSNYKW